MIDVASIFLFFGVPVSLVLLGYGAVLLHERAAPPISVMTEQDPARSPESPASVKPSDLIDLIRAVYKTLESLEPDAQQARPRVRPESKID